MREHRVQKQQTGTEWISPLFGTGRQLRIAERWQRIIDDGEQRSETRYRAEARTLGYDGYDWLPATDNADWLPGRYSAWTSLNATVPGYVQLGLWPETAREIAWRTHCAEWAIGADEIHEEAIFEDKLRGIVATVGVKVLLEIVSSGELLEVLRSMDTQAAA